MKSKKYRNRTTGPPVLFFILLYLILFSALIQAKPMSEQEVKSAVEIWVRHLPTDALPDAVIDRMEGYPDESEAVAYIAHFKDEGFCLCAANDLLLPVYFYSPDGKYDESSPDLKYFLDEIAERTRVYSNAVQNKDLDFDMYRDDFQKRTDLWEDLISGRVPEDEVDKDPDAPPYYLKLDLTSLWHQRSPYNDDCPELSPGNDEHCVVGCAATSMAQIMYYWKWPNSGVNEGSTDYTRKYTSSWLEFPLPVDPNIPTEWFWQIRLWWFSLDGGNLVMAGYWDDSVYDSAMGLNSDPNYQFALTTLYNSLSETTTTLGVSFAAAEYDWSLMNDDHYDYNPVPGDAEVAKLSYHLGVATGSVYRLWATTGFSDKMELAFENNFRYDDDVQYMSRDAVIMITEIQWLRPLILQGCNGSGGCHFWICSGYDIINGEYYMNLGWSDPLNNDWYAIDDLFTVDQDQFAFVAPENVVKFVDVIGIGNGSPTNPYGGIDEAVIEAPDGATLIFKAGSDNTFVGDELIIDAADKELTLKGEDITIRRAE